MPRAGRLNPQRRLKIKNQTMDAGLNRQDSRRESWADIVSVSELSWQPEEEGTGKHLTESMETELFTMTPAERMSWLKTQFNDILRARHRELMKNATRFRCQQCQSKSLDLWKLASRVSKLNRIRMLNDCSRVVFSTWKDMTHSRAFKQDLLVEELRTEIHRLTEENKEMKHMLKMLSTKLCEKDNTQDLLTEEFRKENHRLTEDNQEMKRMLKTLATQLDQKDKAQNIARENDHAKLLSTIHEKDAAQTVARDKDKKEALANLVGTAVSAELALNKRFPKVGSRVESLGSHKDVEQVGDFGTITKIIEDDHGVFRMHTLIDRTQKNVTLPVNEWEKSYKLLF